MIKKRKKLFQCEFFGILPMDRPSANWRPWLNPPNPTRQARQPGPAFWQAPEPTSRSEDIGKHGISMKNPWIWLKIYAGWGMFAVMSSIIQTPSQQQRTILPRALSRDSSHHYWVCGRKIEVVTWKSRRFHGCIESSSWLMFLQNPACCLPHFAYLLVKECSILQRLGKPVWYSLSASATKLSETDD